MQKRKKEMLRKFSLICAIAAALFFPVPAFAGHEPSGTPIRQVKGVRDGDIFTDVRQHWHSANETHTMISGKATFREGNRVELGPGGFNYMGLEGISPKLGPRAIGAVGARAG